MYVYILLLSFFTWALQCFFAASDNVINYYVITYSRYIVMFTSG